MHTMEEKRIIRQRRQYGWSREKRISFIGKLYALTANTPIIRFGHIPGTMKNIVELNREEIFNLNEIREQLLVESLLC